MAHTVRITTTTTENPNVLVLNTGYLKTKPGLLKLCQMILGIVSVALASHHYTVAILPSTVLFYLLMAVAFLISTTCLVVSCVFSWSTGGLISKTMFELIYHSVATILLLVASVILLVNINKYNYAYYYKSTHNILTAAGVVGLVNSILYLCSAVLAQRSYRAI